MFKSLQNIQQFIQAKLTQHRFLRFLLVGFGNTVFAFSIYTVLIVSGVSLASALLIAWLCGTLFNFFSTGGLVFKDLSISRFPRFLIAYIFLIWLNYQCIGVLAGWVSNVIAAQAILSVPLAILSYFVMAIFVFNKQSNVKPLS